MRSITNFTTAVAIAAAVACGERAANDSIGAGSSATSTQAENRDATVGTAGDTPDANGTPSLWRTWPTPAWQKSSSGGWRTSAARPRQ